MNILVLLLITLNLLFPLWCVYTSCITRQGLEVNHVLLFSSGFFIYWILPIAIGVSRLFYEAPIMVLWYGIFDAIPPETLSLYLVITFAAYLSFWLGSEFVRRKLRGMPTYHRLAIDTRLLSLPLIVGTLLAGGLAVVFRNQLFTGYTLGIGGANDDILKGTFVTSSVFLLALAFVYTARKDEMMDSPHIFWKVVLNPYFAAYLLASLLVLSLGGRLYFVSGLVMLLVYRTSYFQRIRFSSALWLLVIGVVFAGLAGLVRQNRNISLEEGWLLIMVEPLFTAFSLIHFLRDNAFELLRFPIFLISNFINLVPSPLFPQKLSYMLAPEEFGYVIYSPGGAENSFFSFMINFGVIGTFFALFASGVCLSYLKVKDRNLLFRVVYVMLCGWLGFTFFRDPFFISIVKTMFQDSLVTPLLIVVLIQGLSSSLKRVSRLGRLDDSSTKAAL